MSGRLTIYVDGVSKGNPGQAGFAFVIYEAGKVVRKSGGQIGVTTNNVAEYLAFIFALVEALPLQAEGITVCSDSLLLVKQLKGEYKVKDEWLKRLHLIARKLIGLYKALEIVHIDREENREADKLANSFLKDSPETLFSGK